MNNKNPIPFYIIVIVAVIVILGYPSWTNNFHLSQGEKCFASQDYICAFKHYREAFQKDVTDKTYVQHYFQTLFKMKKNLIIQEELYKLYENYPNNIVRNDILKIFEQIQNRAKNTYGDNYINVAVQGTNIVHWNNNESIKVYIDNASDVPAYYKTETEKAFSDYQNITEAALKFDYVSNKNDADIIITFTDDVSGGKCQDKQCAKVLGLTENNTSGSALNKSNIALRKRDVDNSEFTQNQIHNLAKHEIGHALGISGHSFEENDIMYPMSNDAQWAKDSATLLIKRKDFSQRDINTIKLLYKILPDITNKYYIKAQNQDMYLPIAILGTKEQIGEAKLEEANKYKSNVTNNFVAQMGLAESYFGSRNFEKAKEEFENALTYASTNDEKFTVYNNLAVIYYQDNDCKTAISYADMANSTTDNITTKNANEIKSYCLIELKEYNKAENLLEELTKQNPTNIIAAASLVNTYVKQYKFIKAYNELKRIKQINPNAFKDPIFQQYKFLVNFI